MKKILAISIIIFAITIMNAQSFYDFKVKTIEGNEFDFATLKGKKVMIVNTASKCGYTPQYAKLQKLYEEYGGEKFIIIGFPANDFLSQEPGTNEEIEEFCKKNYGVTFPIMEKISVNGKDIHPLYQWLTQKALNGITDSKVEWNFQKYIIDENGKIIGVFKPSTNPLSQEIIDLITKE